MKIAMLKTLALVASLLSVAAFAGDGTKDNPYTVAELNAQKSALASSGATVWVKADLKGLGEDGSKTENGTTDATKDECAGLFGDATGTFVAYSYQILAKLAVADLTNTKDLLISLTYGTTGHPYGNDNYPQYASNYEPTDAHFSLEEVHGALTINITNGYRGYHVQSSYIVPSDMVLIKVSSGYSSNVAYVKCENVFDGAEGTYVTNKNSPYVLLGADGPHDVVLTTALYNYTMNNGNSMNPGTQAGVNTNTTKNRWHFRFVATADKVGFERNGSTDTEVVLDSKDEVYLSVNSQASHFAGNWAWETADKKWISWNGKKYSDYRTGINTVNRDSATDGKVYDLQGRRVEGQPQKGLYITNGKKYIAR